MTEASQLLGVWGEEVRVSISLSSERGTWSFGWRDPWEVLAHWMKVLSLLWPQPLSSETTETLQLASLKSCREMENKAP